MGKFTRLVFGDRRDHRRVLADQFGVSVPLSGSPPPLAVDWGRRALDAAGIDASQDPVKAIAVLRRSEMKLSLGTSKYLVKHLT